jgi:uncharacterized protein YdeI (BOF family)
MKVLAEDSKMEINGEPAKGWKEFEVRVKKVTEQIIETSS